MIMSWNEIALAAAAVSFLILTIVLLVVARRFQQSLNRFDSTTENIRSAIDTVIFEFTPVLRKMGDLENTADKTLVETGKCIGVIADELESALHEFKNAAASYERLARLLEARLDQDVTPLIGEVRRTSVELRDLTGQINKRVRQTEDLFEAARETGRTLRSVSGAARSGYMGLAVQMAGVMAGLKTSLDYLSKNLITKGGERHE